MNKLDKLWGEFVERFSEFHRDEMPDHHGSLNFLTQCSSPSMPNILLSSRKGFPLDLLWGEALKRIYNLSSIPYASNHEKYEDTIPYQQCQYYFELDFEHPDIPKDISKVVDLIKIVSLSSPIFSNRHLWILKNIECLRHSYGLGPFRILLERFSANALFICTTTQPSHLDRSLQSRFTHLRIPLLKESHLKNILLKLNVSQELVSKLDTRNIFLAMCYCCSSEFIEYSNLNYPKVTSITTWTVDAVRTLAHQYSINGLTLADACHDIIQMKIKKNKMDVIEWLAKLEAKCAEGNRIREMWFIEMAFTGVFIATILP